jgi:hypothetical protein
MSIGVTALALLWLAATRRKPKSILRRSGTRRSRPRSAPATPPARLRSTRRSRHRASFLLTSGEGWLLEADILDLPGAMPRRSPYEWDNHAIFVR